MEEAQNWASFLFALLTSEAGQSVVRAEAYHKKLGKQAADLPSLPHASLYGGAARHGVVAPPPLASVDRAYDGDRRPV